MNSAPDDVLAELLPLEPIFHTRAFGTTLADFERRMAEDYWEVGASGTRYNRAAILQHLQHVPPVLAADVGWIASDHVLLRIGDHTSLLTYVLQQGQRRTRRATLWQRHAGAWRILYHQGTLAPADADELSA